MTTNDDRLTRLEDAVMDLAMLVSDGNPDRLPARVDEAAGSAGSRFLETMSEIRADRVVLRG
jgi:hypothetical protein